MTVAAAAMSPGVRLDRRRLSGEDARLGKIGEQDRVALEEPAKLIDRDVRDLTLAGPREQAPGEPGDGRIALCMSLREPGLLSHPCGKPAGHQGDQE